MRSEVSLLRGLALAAGAGLLAEAIFLALAQQHAGLEALRSARALRALEVALETVAVALATGLCLRIVSGGRWPRSLGAGVAAAGLALPLCLAFGFYAWPPRLEELRLTVDPIFARRLPLAAAALAFPLLAALGAAGLERLPARARRRGAVAFGLFTALAVAALLLPAASAHRRADQPDILLFSVDTLRADHLGCYGYAGGTSPALDRLCREAIVFERAMAPAPSTIPSYTSIMTGLLQRDHRVYSNYEKAGDELEMLAERLGRAGYVTAAVIEGSFPGTFANLAQGFDFVIQRGVTARTPWPSLAEAARTLWNAGLSVLAERLRWDVSVTTREALRWLSEMPHDVPIFVHFYWPYPHDPYAPPPRYLGMVSEPSADPEVRDAVHAYDGEIRFTDVQLERLLGALEADGRAPEAWIVFTADHGEELGRLVPAPDGGRERYFGHSRYLYDSSLHVPLLVRPPRGSGVEPGRRQAIVSTASITATLLRAAGLEPDPGMLPPLPLERDPASSGAAVSVTRSPVKPLDLVSIRTPEWRLVETRRPAPSIELYRAGEDGESENLALQEPERVRELLEALHAVEPPEASAPPDPSKLHISDRERQRLEALGYLM